ncbi:MAG TPA: hypothetical protein VFQ85_05495 [Mycobacteriales bacterium]|jgi:hypothetical protein|nr:hypothetical protein [Mycobacteriales bacterium]
MSDQPSGERRPGDGGMPLPTTNGWAVFLGIVFGGPLLLFLIIVAWGPVALLLVVFWIGGAVAMMRSLNPFVRGLGVGMMIGGAIVLVLVGSCLALISGID